MVRIYCMIRSCTAREVAVVQVRTPGNWTDIDFERFSTFFTPQTASMMLSVVLAFSDLDVVADSHLEYLRVWSYDLHDRSSVREGVGQHVPHRVVCFIDGCLIVTQCFHLKASSWDGARCGSRPNLTLQGAERKTPKVDRRGRWVGARHHGRVHRDSKTRFPLCVGLPHRESCKHSCGFTSALWSGCRCPEVPMSQYCDSGFEMSRGSNVQFH